MVILIGLVTFFHVKQPDFKKNIKSFLSNTQKCTKNWQKFGFTRNALIFKLMIIFYSKF